MNRAIEILRRVAESISLRRSSIDRLSSLHTELSYLRDRADAEQRGWADRGMRDFEAEARVILVKIRRLDAVELAKAPPSKTTHRDIRSLDGRLAARVRSARAA